MFKSIYVLGNIGKSRWIIRNQWHPYMNNGTFLIQIGKAYHWDRNEYIFTLVGFQLVCIV